MMSGRDAPMTEGAGRPVRPAAAGGGILVSRSPEETRTIGEAVGRHLGPGDWVALEGKLGAGKTHLVQGMARGLGVAEGPITSPTFVFVHEYRGRCPFAHLDLYRIEREEECLQLGILEYFEGPWTVAVEWADKGGSLLPADRLTLRLSEDGELVRKIEISAAGERPGRIVSAILKDPEIVPFGIHRPDPRSAS